MVLQTNNYAAGQKGSAAFLLFFHTDQYGITLFFNIIQPGITLFFRVDRLGNDPQFAVDLLLNLFKTVVLDQIAYNTVDAACRLIHGRQFIVV